MTTSKFPKSPVFPQDQVWPVRKRNNAYESDVTALVRAMLEDDSIREDQKVAWERWRNDKSGLKQP